jgi:superfamily I DNA/RNA helicase
MVQELLANGIEPEEICVLVRQTASKYVHNLLDTFHKAGIAIRLEEPYQLLLKDELIRSIVGMLSLCAGVHPADHWVPALDLLYTLDGIDDWEGKAAFQTEARLTAFVEEMKAKMEVPVETQPQIQVIVGELLSFLGVSRLRAHFPRVQNESSFNKLVSDFVPLLFQCWEGETTWGETLSTFQGLDTIPIMTIHKSKGLEYHTVFFIGLEDAAWWNFAKQSDEETCAFFVAFSRARKQVYFTFCNQRALGMGQTRTLQQRKKVTSLYQMLLSAGVSVRSAPARN